MVWFPWQVYFLVARSMVITGRLNLPSDRGSKRISSVQFRFVGKVQQTKSALRTPTICDAE